MNYHEQRHCKVAIRLCKEEFGDNPATLDRMLEHYISFKEDLDPKSTTVGRFECRYLEHISANRRSIEYQQKIRAVAYAGKPVIFFKVLPVLALLAILTVVPLLTAQPCWLLALVGVLDGVCLAPVVVNGPWLYSAQSDWGNYWHPENFEYKYKERSQTAKF